MISREEAVEYFVYCLTELKMDREAIREAYKLAIEALSQPERPKGRWIDKTVWCGTLGICRVQCSECGTVFDGRPASRGDGRGGKYCEECGADMRGEEE